MNRQTLRRDLSTLWSDRVELFPIIQVFLDLSRQDPSRAESLLQEALALPGPEAASFLMRPAAEALSWKETQRLGVAHRAIHVLVQAGGDPTPVLEVLFERLGIDDERERIRTTIREVIYRGWDIGPLTRFPDAFLDDPRVADAYRLARLQRAMPQSISLLESVHTAQRFLHLVPGLQLLEAALLGDSREQAMDCLVGCGAADGDLFATWVALLPVMTDALRSAATRPQAARVVATVPFALERSQDPDCRERMPTLVHDLTTNLAVGLNDATVQSSGACADALLILAVHGASLEPGKADVSSALQHSSVYVREKVSRALSVWLAQSGQEATLPDSCSHRRIYATSDAPIDFGRTIECIACGAMAVPIYFDEDIYTSHTDATLEAKCTACGLYTERHWDY